MALKCSMPETQTKRKLEMLTSGAKLTRYDRNADRTIALQRMQKLC